MADTKSKVSTTSEGDSTPPQKDPNDKDLEKQDFYHGYRPRSAVETLLKEPGDFLVRVTDAKATGGEAMLVVSAMSEEKKLLNLSLQHTDGQWHLAIEAMRKKPKKPKKDGETMKTRKLPAFTKVVELIQYYKTHKMPGKAFLRHAIPRPDWLISHEKVEYKQTDLLGSGNFCHVYRGVYHRTENDKFDVAVKVCHEGKVATDTNEESTEARKGMITEAQLMSHYAYEYIIQMFGVAMGHPPILILMEFCAGGNLENHLKNCGDRLDVGEAVIYALEAARGMRYLHSVGCVHRDLAARNVLISSKGTMKIADFGLSKMVGELEKPTDSEESKDSPQIPIRWMAPESLKKPMVFSPKTDVWSFGVLLYEIYNKGVKPWPDDVAKKVATMIRKGNMPAMPDKSPAPIVALVKAIWVIPPEQRPEMKKVTSLLKAMRKQVPAPADMTKWMINEISGVSRGLPESEMKKSEDEDESDKAQKKQEGTNTTTITDKSVPTVEAATPLNLGKKKPSAK